ncbi:Hint domain-containing protein [Ancylobacter sonchi]|uniref:Hint domain-containing protein n=1 Tax=Ancylobacter sonchi TaxID=1937790 RepID=UPI001BD55E1C|nr:Hint domain-containing protein [Ancylobacter sonchi]MBS7534684.1 Hint domain-containing protein [Ancylobacter sonchi]
MATFTATGNNQTLNGTTTADSMYNKGYSNITLNGSDGNDTIYGSGGAGGLYNGDAGDDGFYTYDPSMSSMSVTYNSVFNGGEGNDFFSSRETYNTTYNGGDGDDRLSLAYGWSGAFNGGAGDDSINTGDFGTSEGTGNGEGGNASAAVDGGEGNDTATFYHAMSLYSFRKEGGTVFITDTAVGGRTTISFTNIETFQFSNDGGGTLQDYTFSELPCFLPGTLIATPSGGIAIETLKAGDLVATADGAVRPVRWLARQTVSTRFANPLKVMPIRICAGALGKGMPARDLYVSPDHALYLDGLLIQAEALVNGSSIVRHTDMPERFTYYHVELDDHSLILAEQTPAETFIDNVTRKTFDNWHEAPEAPVARELEHPRVKSARQLSPFIRNLLAMRARAMGFVERAA